MNKKALLLALSLLQATKIIHTSIGSYSVFTKGTQTIYVFGDIHTHDDEETDGAFLDFLDGINDRQANATLVVEFLPENVAHMARVDTLARRILQQALTEHDHLGIIAVQALDRREAVGYELMTFIQRVASCGGIATLDPNDFNARNIYDTPQYTIGHLTTAIDALIADITAIQAGYAPATAEQVRLEIIKRTLARYRIGVINFFDGFAPTTIILDAITTIINAQHTCIATATFIDQTLYPLLQAMIENGFVHRIVSDITPHHNLILHTGNNHALYLHTTLPLLGYTCVHHESMAIPGVESIVIGILDAEAMLDNCLAALQ